jgi:hypothetical protein
MHLGRVGNPIAVATAALLVCAAQAQYRPEVPVLKCAHEGEPVPQVPGATFSYLFPPEIDGAGNVLFSGSMTGAGIGPSNNEGIWYGQPGAMSLVARDGWPAPDLPGVVYSSVSSVGEACSKDGYIVFTAYLTGSGVTPDVNDKAVFCGSPGELHLVKRTGDPVPEVGPSITISGTEHMGACISGNGTLLVGAELAGDGLPPTVNHQAWWVGPRDALQLAVWEGMPAPGCPDCDPGMYLEWVSYVRFNDAGQVAFYAAMAGPVLTGISPARWMGTPNSLAIMQHRAQLMPQFGPGVSIRCAVGGLNAMNSYGDNVDRIQLQGTGVTAANDWTIIGGEPLPVSPIAREGDPAPEAGEGTYAASVSAPFINNLHEVLYRVKLAGPEIDESNQYAMYLGPYAGAPLILRDGAPAPYFPPGTSLYNVGLIWGMAAMNDVGDFVGVAGVESPATGQLAALGLWRGLTRKWVPLLESGAVLFARTLTLADPICDYWTETGGADGVPQSFNNRRQLATQLDFTDGTTGIYRIGPPLLGDTDGDGQVGPAELMAFAECATGPGGSVGLGCDALDLNLDTTIDLRDMALLQAMVGEER